MLEKAFMYLFTFDATAQLLTIIWAEHVDPAEVKRCHEECPNDQMMRV